MNRTITVGSECFTLVNREYVPITRYWCLTDAYSNPSRYKREIWEYWKQWHKAVSEGKHDYITICSRNCHMFSINGRVTLGGIEYAFYISKTRKYIYRK